MARQTLRVIDAIWMHEKTHLRLYGVHKDLVTRNTYIFYQCSGIVVQYFFYRIMKDIYIMYTRLHMTNGFRNDYSRLIFE